MDSTSTSATFASNAEQTPPRGSLVRRFLELIRFSHTVFALPFALLATAWAIAASGSQTAMSAGELSSRLLGVLLCMVFARSAAMSFNRLADARIDGGNPRTSGRHLPAGLLSASQVWSFFVGMSMAFVASCLLFLPNWLPVALSVPVLLWICGYSYAKRLTSAAHLWLGVALALSPICAWVAMRGEVVIATPTDIIPAVWLAVAISLWVTGFDIIYACQDADFDRNSGLKSIPARLGIAGALRTAAILHVGMLVVLAMLPSQCPQLSLGWIYAVALMIVGVLILRQHTIVNPKDLGRVNEAFFNINATISLFFCTAAAVDAFL